MFLQTTMAMASTSARPKRESNPTYQGPLPSLTDEDESTTSSPDEEDGSGSSSGAGKGGPSVHRDDFESDAESDIDAPRIAQWADEDVQDEDIPSGRLHASRVRNERICALKLLADTLQAARDVNQDLSTMPFGALLKARKALDQAQAHVDSDSDSESELDEEEEPLGFRRSRGSDVEKSKGRSAEISQPRKVVEKRQHKHAYVLLAYSSSMLHDRTLQSRRSNVD